MSKQICEYPCKNEKHFMASGQNVAYGYNQCLQEIKSKLEGK